MKKKERSRMHRLMDKLGRSANCLGPPLRPAERRWLEKRLQRGLREAQRERMTPRPRAPEPDAGDEVVQ